MFANDDSNNGCPIYVGFDTHHINISNVQAEDCYNIGMKLSYYATDIHISNCSLKNILGVEADSVHTSHYPIGLQLQGCQDVVFENTVFSPSTSIDCGTTNCTTTFTGC
jgi:hypothetical protein